MEAHARDPKTGLLYHGWDESKQQQWADKTTGRSPHIWARAMGWYGCALVDALDWFPKDHPRRKELVGILNRLVSAIAKVQQPGNGLWYDIIDVPRGKGNYFEASAANMFVYTIAKGVRLGYIPVTYLPVAIKGWEGILKKFVREENGVTQFDGTVKVSGLSGNPYRDGSFEYYMREPVISNDPKGIGTFLMASNEMSMVPLQTLGKGKEVVLDLYFNNEYRKNAFGVMERFHYTWEDKANSGYATLGAIFRQYGAHTSSLPEAPTAHSLKSASVYIIVDPDTEKETAQPHYMNETDATSIYNWVKAGGTLVLMSNDSGNAEFKNFNILSEKFGIHYNENSINRVKNDHYETGALYIKPGDPIFKQAKKVYVKEVSTFTLKAPAKAHFTNENGDIIIATARIGKGTVFAVGDPWFYNEYVDGRKLPAEYENFTAATDLVKWLLSQKNKQ
jgi:unsaturated rhamnogalacturonyl hydrolase